MGNSGSNSHQHCASNGPSPEMGRGWTQSFPRELTRHHSQPAGRKVLPEPPNQRLRATDNGSIIHKGGTISGRRPPALTLPHDLNKGVFRSRSTSASNIAEPRPRKIDRHCCHYRSDSSRLEGVESDLKRFGSEPDLRYSPESNLPERYLGKPNGRVEGRSSVYYVDREARDARERESRYKGRKKYKAPAPPAVNGLADGSSPESCKWEMTARDGGPRCRFDEDVHPPPRRSRLFKTRAESKKAQVNWHFSTHAASPSHRPREEKERLEGDPRWKNDRGCSDSERTLACPVWRDPRDRLQRSSYDPKRSRHFDGKNTLQRSMSSPEFQAELIQVARKVRDKLNCGGKTSVQSTVAESPAKFRSLDRQRDEFDRCATDRTFEEIRKNSETRVSGRRELSLEEGKVVEGKGAAREEKITAERCRRREAKAKLERKTDSSREEHPDGTSEGKGRISERSSKLENERTSVEPIRKPLRERLEVLGHRLKTDYSMDRWRHGENGKSGKIIDAATSAKITRNGPENSSARFLGDGHETRGWAPERPSTSQRMEQRGGDKENSDPRWWKGDSRNGHSKLHGEKKRPETVEAEKLEEKFKSNLGEKKGTERREGNWHVIVSTEKSTPKTFYFGMNEPSTGETRTCSDQRPDQILSKSRDREGNSGSPVCTVDETEDGKNVIEDISLKLRPTLPKKQLEIPRFSPSAAWRLLSALEAPGPTMSTASEEMPVMFEERIERLSRPPPPMLALGPRSLHDKSGDSGISGDAGAPNEDSLDVSTTNRMKTPATRPTWTPQQDLGEESSSDAGVDSPPPMPIPVKYSPRAHVFSLSLPREDNRTYLYDAEAKAKESSTFNSLQKLKRSVSGALGLGLGLVTNDLERKSSRDILDDNWLLSTSAPTSLQHNQITEPTRTSPAGWRPSFDDEDGEADVDDEEDDDEEEEEEEDVRPVADPDVDEDDGEESDERKDFPVIMKPPSFSYLASGGHVMYLPDSTDTEYRTQSLNSRKADGIGNEKTTIYKKKGTNEVGKASRGRSSGFSGSEKTSKRSKDSRSRNGESGTRSTTKLSTYSKSCENISEMKQRSDSPISERLVLQGTQKISETKEIKAQPKSSSKSRRFTFQSTVRQIERRRLAEKLSREAEAKERQRKGELEAMRKVEEEFQRKRAREKANIRQQLRLYNMEENLNSLPAGWDGSQLSRAEPDGAPSSTASSPTSAPPGKLPTMPRKSSVSSDELHRKRALNSFNSKQPRQHQREHKNHRPKYYDWAPDNSSHMEYKQTTVHPKIICDIPKSSPVFVDANVHPSKPANSNTTPRSDNYRKDFAHGAVAARSSLASSDSELSQPNTRPHSRQTGIKGKPLRSRSASPERSEDVGVSSGDESPLDVDPVKQQRNTGHDFMLNGVQPFVREKTYRPISFNPQPPPPILS